jgi:hypothetical protein
MRPPPRARSACGARRGRSARPWSPYEKLPKLSTASIIENAEFYWFLLLEIFRAIDALAG